jgi:hypothetical protein
MEEKTGKVMGKNFLTDKENVGIMHVFGKRLSP